MKPGPPQEPSLIPQKGKVPQFNQTLITSLFASILLFEASYLQTLYEFKQLYKNYYQNPNLELQVNENQHKLRALKFVFNRLQCEIDVKDDEVSDLR